MSSEARLAASFDAIRERLFSLASDRNMTDGALVVTLMSRTASEGVTTATVGLARSLARSHAMRTLLIDHDEGKHGAAAILGVTARTFPGFSADGGAPALKDCIQLIEPASLDLLTLNPAVPSAFPGDAWAEAFAALRGSYGLVLVDCGSALSSLTIRWGRIANRRVLVLDTSRTTEEELGSLAAELKTAELRLDAVILNKRDFPVPRFLYRYVR